MKCLRYYNGAKLFLYNVILKTRKTKEVLLYTQERNVCID